MVARRRSRRKWAANHLRGGIDPWSTRALGWDLLLMAFLQKLLGLRWGELETKSKRLALAPLRLWHCRPTGKGGRAEGERGQNSESRGKKNRETSRVKGTRDWGIARRCNDRCAAQAETDDVHFLAVNADDRATVRPRTLHKCYSQTAWSLALQRSVIWWFFYLQTDSQNRDYGPLFQGRQITHKSGFVNCKLSCRRWVRLVVEHGRSQ